MPVLDGFRVLAQLRSDPGGAELKVVALTAFSMPNDRLQVLTAGFNGYLSKPIEPAIFVEQIEAFLPASLLVALPRAGF
jgi:CheY-like chemotaxis protein